MMDLLATTHSNLLRFILFNSSRLEVQMSLGNIDLKDHENQFSGKQSILAFCVAFLWYSIIASRSIGRWMGINTVYGTDASYLEGSLIDRCFFLALIILAVLILLSRRLDWSALARQNFWLFVLLAYMLLSICWSDYGEVSLKRWIKVFGSIMISMVVLSTHNYRKFVMLVLRSSFYWILPLSIIFIKYFRNLGIGWDSLEREMWMGVTTHKNCLGEVTMVSSLYFIWNLLPESKSPMPRWIVYSYLSMSIYLLVGSGSKTSLIVFLLSLLLLLAMHSMRSHIGLLSNRARVLLRFVIIAALLFFTKSHLFLRGPLSGVVTLSGRDSTLTGRTDLWYDVMKIASNHPIIGVGFGSFWIGNTHGLWNIHYWLPTQAHNGYLDVYVELGLLGIILLVMLLLSALKTVMSNLESDFEFSMLMVTFLFMILMHDFTESSFLRGDHSIWFLFLLLSIQPPITKAAKQVGSDLKGGFAELDRLN
jgi:exopolysaccharide production protein ExoQ